jgi:hypothetical protein
MKHKNMIHSIHRHPRNFVESLQHVDCCLGVVHQIWAAIHVHHRLQGRLSDDELSSVTRAPNY